MNTKDNQRNATIDLLKLFAIFLVLWGHCVQQFLSTPATGNEVYLTIYSLHMPLFMMLSGYFSHSSLQLSFKDFIRKKSTQLLLPVISWSIIILLLYTICDLTIHKADYSSSSFKENLISAFGNFWFLKSLFVCYLLAFCGKKTKLHPVIWVIATIFVSQLISAYNVKGMYPCFLTGMLLSANKNNIKKYGNTLLCISLSVYAIMMFFWESRFLEPANIIGAISDKDITALCKMLFIRFYRIAIGITGAISLFVVFDKLSTVWNNGRIAWRLAKCGAYTLEIYILQVIILEIGLGAFVCCDSLNITFFNYFVSPAVSILVLLSSLLITKIIYKNRLCSFLLFAKMRKKQ